MERNCSGRAGPRRLPRRERLHHALLVCDQAGDRQGRADLELRHRPRPAPWRVGDAPDAFIDAQIKGIIGVEIAITDIEGKWKVSQNRPKADIAEVIEGLGAAAGVHANPGMADLVRRYGADR
jgi:predicted FMN-binding regulatory protein PaiB